MGQLTVTKRMEFCYGHRLPNYDGRCKNLHGHNAVVEITCRRNDGDVATGKEEKPAYPQTYPGMVIDFSLLKKAMVEIIDQLDHKYLNDIEHFPSPPTAENMARWIAIGVHTLLPPGIAVMECRVSETPDSWATWTKD